MGLQFLIVLQKYGRAIENALILACLASLPADGGSDYPSNKLANTSTNWAAQYSHCQGSIEALKVSGPERKLETLHSLNEGRCSRSAPSIPSFQIHILTET